MYLLFCEFLFICFLISSSQVVLLKLKNLSPCLFSIIPIFQKVSKPVLYLRALPQFIIFYFLLHSSSNIIFIALILFPLASLFLRIITIMMLHLYNIYNSQYLLYLFIMFIFIFTLELFVDIIPFGLIPCSDHAE